MKKPGSPSWKLGGHDLKKITTGALVAASGAGIAYLLDYLGTVNMVEAENWWVPLAVAGLGVFANAVRKFATNTQR